MSRVVLGSSWPGLGDQLQFSTLPEIFSSLGHDVYISDLCEYRNDEIKDLVWRTNPFIRGFVREHPNVGAAVPMRQLYSSIVSNWEHAHFNQVFNKYPKIYYKPKTISAMSNKILLDLSAISDKYEDEKLIPAIQNKIGDATNVVRLTFKNDVGSKEYMNGYYTTYCVKSIFEYIDCIASCQEFICLMSGGAVAASALEHMGLTPLTTVFMSVPKQIFKFDNINYKEL